MAPDRESQAAVCYSMGNSYFIERRYADALPWYRQATRLSTAQTRHAMPAESALAATEAELGMYEAAAARYRRILLDRETLLGVDHPQTALLRGNYGVALERAGDHDGARAQYASALTSLRASFPDDDPRVGLMTRNLEGLEKPAATPLDRSRTQ